MDSLLSSSVRSSHIADSRLLSNLIRSEKDHVSHLSSVVAVSHAAASALAAWGTSEVSDVAATSEELSRLLHEIAEAQRTHVQAIEGCRAALKDVLDREASIRDVVRDRDILINRLIKASKKKVKDGREDTRAEKVHDAQRELQACEQILASEEAALIGVKRRTFKEALTMRMKTMGDVGNAMVEAAQEAILLLDEFDSNAMGPQSGRIGPTSGGDIGYAQDGGAYHAYTDGEQFYGRPAYGQENEYDQRYMDGHHRQFSAHDSSAALENASVTPSQSASQTATGASGAAPFFTGPNNGPLPAPHRLGPNVGTGGEAFIPHGQQAQESDARSKTPMPPPPDHPYAANTHSNTNDAHSQQGISLVALPQAYQPGQHLHVQHEYQNEQSVAPTPPKKDVRTANGAQYQQQQQPQRPDEESSSEDDERPTTAHAGGGARAMRIGHGAPGGGGGHARNISTDMSSSFRSHDSPVPCPTRGSGSRAVSERDPKKKPSGFLGRVGKLFKTDVKEAVALVGTPSSRGRRDDGSDDGDDGYAGAGNTTWHTRTDSNLRSARASIAGDLSSSGLTRSGSRRQSLLKVHAFPSSRHKGDDGDGSSSEEPDPSSLVKHVNQPKPMWNKSVDSGTGLLSLGSSSKGKGKKASSDNSPSPFRRSKSLLKRSDSSASKASIIAGPRSSRQKQEEDDLLQRARMSVMSAGLPTVRAPSSAVDVSTVNTAPKKKKKRTPSISGSEIGTSATRMAPTAASASTSALLAQRAVGHGSVKRSSTVIVSGDASSGMRRSDLLNPVGRGSVKSSRTKQRQSLSGNGLMEAKHATGSWVAKPVDATAGSAAPKKATAAAEVVADAGIVPKGQGVPTSQAVSTATQHVQENACNTSNPVSRSKGPLKPALKNSLSRSNSTASKAGRRPPIPDMGPVIQAPPPATSLLNVDNLYKEPVACKVDIPPPATTPTPGTAAGNSQSEKTRSELPKLHELSEKRTHESDDDNESFSSARPGLSAHNSYRSVNERPALATAGSFDGTGTLNMQLDGAASGGNPAVATPEQSNKLETPKRQACQGSLPRLEMPICEPFSISLDGRKNSPAQVHELDGGLVTPGEQQAIQKLLAAGEEADAAAAQKQATQLQQQQRHADGVTRTTASRTKFGSSTASGKLTPSRVYGKGAPELSSSDEEDSPAPKQLEFGSSQSTAATSATAPSTSTATAATTMTPPPMLHSAMRSHSPAPKSALNINTTGSVVSDASGSGGGRRKSVRLAPDTKLPPETPTLPGPDAGSMFQVSAPGSSISGGIPTANHSSTKNGASQLSLRIAPPPAAPSRIMREQGPIDLAADCASSRSSWTTRIGVQHDDSSDDDIAVGGDDEYSRARRAFSSASMHLGKATGSIKAKAKATADGDSISSKKKKRLSKQDFGYNPDVPLPPTMQVVGRSSSTRR